MMQFGFNGYEGFKELFIREDGRRKNGVLLSFWKNREIRAWARRNGCLKKILRISGMAELFSVCDELVRQTYEEDARYSVHIFGNRYRSNKYSDDSHGGVCEDGDFTSFRYVNNERDATFKMKMGKIYKHLILCSEFGKVLNQQVVLFMCEEMTRKWQAENASKYSGFLLHVDDDFSKIYSSRYLKGGFGSCMVDEDREDFYENAVEAKAAYLTNEDGLVVARCVIYTNCHDEDGKVWRLAERQYSSGGDETLKMILVYTLIKGGHIDGYKKVGADCHSPRSFLDIHGNPIPNPKFWIKCEREVDDIISYQDSFKHYCMYNRKAYNFDDGQIAEYYDLSTTDRYLSGGNWDEYHEEYTSSDLVTVVYCGEEMSCAEDALGDFRWVNSECMYYYCEDVCYCEQCREYYVNGSGFYSDLTDKYYCCDDCLRQAEHDYKENNWEYSEYDDEYVEEAKVFYRAIASAKTYVETTIKEESLDELIESGEVVERDGDYYEVSVYFEEWYNDTNN